MNFFPIDLPLFISIRLQISHFYHKAVCYSIKMKLFLLLNLIIFQISYTSTQFVPHIQTNIGIFEGRSINFANNANVDIFYGIPFANVPKRFDVSSQLYYYIATQSVQKPGPPIRSATNRSAKHPKPSCSQLTNNKGLGRITSEDCLYLNLFKPTNSNKQTALVVFIHGGGYTVGSDSIHSLDYMAENYATKGIIYATVHYRLGLMGQILTKKSILWIFQVLLLQDIPNLMEIWRYGTFDKLCCG